MFGTSSVIYIYLSLLFLVFTSTKFHGYTSIMYVCNYNKSINVFTSSSFPQKFLMNLTKPNVLQVGFIQSGRSRRKPCRELEAYRVVVRVWRVHACSSSTAQLEYKLNPRETYSTYIKTQVQNNAQTDEQRLWPCSAGWKNGWRWRWCWCWFVVRKKYYYFTETVRLVSSSEHGLWWHAWAVPTVLSFFSDGFLNTFFFSDGAWQDIGCYGCWL